MAKKKAHKAPKKSSKKTGKKKKSGKGRKRSKKTGKKKSKGRGRSKRIVLHTQWGPVPVDVTVHGIVNHRTKKKAARRSKKTSKKASSKPRTIKV